MDRQDRQESQESLDRLAAVLVDSIVTVHRGLGPGLLESSYQHCLAHELASRGIKVHCSVPVPLKYREATLDVGYRLDMVVDGRIVVEHKVVDALAPVHLAQLMTYLKLGGLRLGFLVNWNVTRIRDGMRRVVYRQN